MGVEWAGVSDTAEDQGEGYGQHSEGPRVEANFASGADPDVGQGWPGHSISDLFRSR